MKKIAICDTVKIAAISIDIAMLIMGAISKLQSSSPHPEAANYKKKKKSNVGKMAAALENTNIREFLFNLVVSKHSASSFP